MFLLVRNVLPDDKPGFEKPVKLVRKAIADICSSDDGNSLSEITLDLIPGGRPQDTHCASVYMELSQEIKTLDSLPRPDLLADWKIALAKYQPTWDVVWAPQKKGKDRRMTVRFRVAESKDLVPANAADKIRAHLETKGHRTIGGYVSFGGLVDVMFADTNSVDLILSSNYYLVPSLSKEGLHVSSPKFMPVNNPFELCIGGLNEYEGLHEVIEKWLYHKYRHDDIQASTRVFDTRISTDREYFIFTMDSWESTTIVLKDTDDFRTYFANSPNLTDPKLLYELNSSGFGRKSVASVIDAGASFVNDAINSLKREISDFRKEQSENNSMVQRQVASIHVNMENQTNAVTLMGNQLHQFGLSLLAGRDEKAIESRISGIDNSLLFEMQCLRSTDDVTQKASIQSAITKLQVDRREQALLLAKATENTLRLIGPAPGTAVPLPVTARQSQPVPPVPVGNAPVLATPVPGVVATIYMIYLWLVPARRFSPSQGNL
jgi:hypothetical protein